MTLTVAKICNQNIHMVRKFFGKCESTNAPLNHLNMRFSGASLQRDKLEMGVSPVEWFSSLGILGFLECMPKVHTY